MLNTNDLEKAKLIQGGLSQFEEEHMAAKEENAIICAHCRVDFPCERMLLFMLLQSIAALTSMIPTGNMAGIMKRFGGQ